MKKTGFTYKVLLLFLLISFLAILPILVNPDLFFSRGNDLQEYFLPNAVFLKKTFLDYKTLPLWNTIYYGGITLASYPQAPIYYFPNFLYIFLPIRTATIVLLYSHLVFAGIFAYFLSKELGFTKFVSILMGFLFILTPKLAAYIEAGHMGLLFSWPWIILFAYSIVLSLKRLSFRSICLTAVSGSLIYLTHITTFMLVVPSGFVSYLVLAFTKKRVSVYFVGFSSTLMLGLSSFALVPQLLWKDQTTREFLMENPEIYPVWRSKMEFFLSAILPYRGSIEGLWSITTEKWIPFGVLILFLAFLGFLRLRKLYKTLVILAGALLGLVMLNNASPLYLLLSQNPVLKLVRVSTRFWVVAYVIVAFLAGHGLGLFKNKKLLLVVISFLIVLESFFYYFAYLGKPSTSSTKIPQEVVDFIKSDTDIFRIYCHGDCISQLTVAENNFEALDGYSTVQQKNYFYHSWVLFGGHWDQYTLAIPPFGAKRFGNLNPNYSALGDLNVKYVISKTELVDINLEPLARYQDYNIYLNNLYKPRTNGEIVFYSPNKLIVRPDPSDLKLIVRSTYSDGWKAYGNGRSPVEINKNKDTTYYVNIGQEVEFIEFRYEPPGLRIGLVISAVSLAVVLIGFFPASQSSVNKFFKRFNVI